MLIATKKRLWVISLWVSAKYAEFLLKHRLEGMDVKFITTTNLADKDKKVAEKLAEIEGLLKGLLKVV